MSFLLRKFDFSGAGSGKKKVLYKRLSFPRFPLFRRPGIVHPQWKI
jgi:hypothetical protein